MGVLHPLECIFSRSESRFMSNPSMVSFDGLNCPLPLTNHRQVLLGHGSGGTLTADLIQKMFLPAWDNDVLSALEDQATLDLNDHVRGRNGSKAPRIAFTTDSFVVRPLFFPGGDIGKL